MLLYLFTDGRAVECVSGVCGVIHIAGDFERIQHGVYVRD